MDKKSFIVAAISVFNAEKTIARAVLSAQKHADRVLVCDDGSSDMTAGVAEHLRLVLGAENMFILKCLRVFRV